MIKKNIAKKITAVAVGVALSAMSCMTVFADYVHEVGWSDQPCPRCHEDAAVWITETRYDASPTGEERGCDHHRFGTDLKMEVVTLITYRCHECNYIVFDTEKAYYWECCGFEMPGND